MDERLLKATDAAAKRKNTSRSALIRDALEQHLKRLQELDMEDQDRRGYQAKPQLSEEFSGWEGVAAWPED